MSREKTIKNYSLLWRDLAILLFSILLAALLAKSGWLERALIALDGWFWLASFLAGFFFVSLFTAAPAAIVIAALAQTGPVGVLAFWAGLGGTLGDLLIFRFIRDRLSAHLAQAFSFWWSSLRFLGESKLFRYLAMTLGALLVASPLPDEIGLTLMGASNLPIRYFIPLVFVLDTLGILILATAMSSLLL